MKISESLQEEHMIFPSISTEWLTPKQAAEYLGCSRSLLDKDRITGLLGIPFSRLGRHIRYSRKALDAFLEANSSTVTEVKE